MLSGDLWWALIAMQLYSNLKWSSVWLRNVCMQTGHSRLVWFKWLFKFALWPRKGQAETKNVSELRELHSCFYLLLISFLSNKQICHPMFFSDSRPREPLDTLISRINSELVIGFSWDLMTTLKQKNETKKSNSKINHVVSWRHYFPMQLSVAWSCAYIKFSQDVWKSRNVTELNESYEGSSEGKGRCWPTQ